MLGNCKGPRDSTQLGEALQTADCRIARIDDLALVVEQLMAVVGAHRDLAVGAARRLAPALLGQHCAHEGHHVDIAVEMGGLVEALRVRLAPGRPQMQEMHAPGETLEHGQEIIVRPHAIGAGAEGEPVRRALNPAEEPGRVLGHRDDARQAEQRARRVVGVDRKAHPFLLGDRHHRVEERTQAFAQALRADPVIALIILFGIVGGFFTPIEASVVAALYAFLVGAFVYRGYRLRDVPRIVTDSAISSAAIILLVGFANVFGYILTSERIPQIISEAVLSISDNPYVVILLINIVLLFVGMFMETIAALIILIPPLLAVAQQVGIDPLHFATFAILNLMLGLTTPPLGVCLFVAGNIAKVSMVDVVKAIWPFLLGNIVVLLLVSYIPALSKWLPSLFY